jgi:hypothetical protein
MVAKAVSKPLTEIANSITDAQTLNIGKLNISNTTTSLQNTFFINKVPLDQSTILESTALKVDTNIAIKATLQDSFLAQELLVYFSSANVQTDILQQLLVLPEYQDGTNALDVYNSTVNYYRDFFDSVYSTDDYYGLSNVDDDQTAKFIKSLISASVFSEEIASNVAISKANTFALLDAAAVEVAAQYLSPGTVQESLVLLSTKKLDSSVVLTDLNAATVNTFTNTNTTVQEQNVALVQQTSTSNSLILDAASADIAKLLNNILNISLVQNFAVSTNYLDIIQIPERLEIDTSKYLTSGLQASIDTPVLADYVSTTSSAYTQDLLTAFKFIEYILQDAGSASDTGYANNQNYFAEAYAEPGYVGTNTYFS